MPARIRPTRTNPDGWIGEQLSVGTNKERFYGGIRIDGESFHVGDAVFVRCERSDTQVMKIDALWEDASGVRSFEGRWFYTPEETTCGRLVGHDPRELFETVHVDENLVETIDGLCTILNWETYQQWLDSPGGGEMPLELYMHRRRLEERREEKKEKERLGLGLGLDRHPEDAEEAKDENETIAEIGNNEAHAETPVRVEVLVVAALRQKERKERGANPSGANFPRVNLEEYKYF